ncbi:MAG: hypothetical protein ABGX40_01715 [Methylococcales bacterium]
MKFIWNAVKKLILKAAIKQALNARNAEGSKSKWLLINAYQGHADIAKNEITRVDDLYD